MGRETQRFRLGILAWSLIVNNDYLIAVSEDKRAFARAIGEAHKRFSGMRNFAEGVWKFLFQWRFGSCLLDENPLLPARYPQKNPFSCGNGKGGLGKADL